MHTVKSTLYRNEVLFEMNCVATELTLNCVSLCHSWQETDLRCGSCKALLVWVGDQSGWWRTSVQTAWEKLALALQFRCGVIRAVRESERPLVEPACRRILERWSVDGEGQQPVTWETLVEFWRTLDTAL